MLFLPYIGGLDLMRHPLMGALATDPVIRERPSATTARQSS
jgi:hypothetical protein